MKISPDVTVRWQSLSEQHPGWDALGCLYAYLTPDMREILYIGKAWGVTVRRRWNRTAKENFWKDLEKQRGIRKHCPLLGEVKLNYAGRLSSALLKDVESLLIIAEQPWGNIQNRIRRAVRPGLSVECSVNGPAVLVSMSTMRRQRITSASRRRASLRSARG